MKVVVQFVYQNDRFPNTLPPPRLLSVGLVIGRSIFNPHPSKDDGFLNREVRIFSSKKPTKFGPFNGRFQGNESKVLKV